MPEPTIAAAGLMAGSGLLQQLMAQEAQRRQAAYEGALAREMFERRAREEREASARSSVQQSQQNQIALAGRAGDTERDALAQLIAVFDRSRR